MKKNKTVIPNIIFYIGLNPYLLSLYVILKHEATDLGKVSCGNRMLADKLSCSPKTVRKYLKQLAAIEIEGVKLITVIERHADDGGQLTHEVTIGDISQFYE